MHKDFEGNFRRIMMQAGYEEINIPASFSCPAKIVLWGKLAGSVLYYYVVYDLSVMGFADFDVIKKHIDQGLEGMAQRNNIRHTVIINILTGVCPENIDGVTKLIDSQEEFALLPRYDVYYGVDLAGRQIMQNNRHKMDIDKALSKIKTALEADLDKMFHVEQGRPEPKSKPSPSVFAVPVAKYPILTYIIIAVNIFIFVLMELGGGSTEIETLLRFGAVSHHHVFTLGEYHRLITPIFLHIGGMHLIFNTTSLILFGIRAEKYFGHLKFFVIYMLSGVAGNLAMAATSEFSVGAGASGAIFGIIGALFAFTKLRKKLIENFNGSALGIMIIFGILMGFTMGRAPGMPNVGNMAHLGGLIMGFGLGWLLAKKK